MNKTAVPQIPRAAVKPISSLSQQLGGETALDALIGAFYFNVLLDDRVAHFFANTDVDAIRNHQRKFLAMALGATDEYCDGDLREAHHSLVRERGLNQSHFDVIVEILASTLSKFGHAAELSQEILNRVTALRGEVLGTNS